MPTDTVTLPNVQIQGNLSVAGNLPEYPRTSLAVNTNQIIALPFHIWRIHDSLAVLPNTSSSNDLGWYHIAHGTSPGSYIGTADLKAAGSTTNNARCFAVLPPEYIAAATVSLRFSAGCITTIADTTATLDVEVRKVARDGTLGSELYSGAALTIRSVTFSEKQFALDSSTLLPGDILDIKAILIVNDAATATAVIGAWRAAEIYTSIQG